MTNSAPEIKAKFDSPDFVENNEEMLKEEFTKYFQVKFFFQLQSTNGVLNYGRCTEYFLWLHQELKKCQYSSFSSFLSV